MSITFIEWLQTKNEQADGNTPLGNTLGLGQGQGQGQAANQPNPAATNNQQLGNQAGNQTTQPNQVGNPKKQEETPADVEFIATLKPAMKKLIDKLGKIDPTTNQKKTFLTSVIAALGPIFQLSGTQVVQAVKKGIQQPPQQQ